jgi:hypothetical protein
MGFRPAALFPLLSEGCLECLSGILPPGVNLMTLRKNGARTLVILFEKGLLERTIAREPVRSLLSDMGYAGKKAVPETGGSLAFVYLECLRQKFEEFHQFPHEIGLFLGYPPDDVLGFMKHKGQHYKLNGCWKVYGNVEKAIRDFRCYDECRRYMKTYLQGGGLLRDFRDAEVLQKRPILKGRETLVSLP